ncbi:unnamed protein product, partial [Protopolystoma xenopodis]
MCLLPEFLPGTDWPLGLLLLPLLICLPILLLLAGGRQVVLRRAWQRRLAVKHADLARQQLRVRARLAELGIPMNRPHPLVQGCTLSELRRRLAERSLRPRDLLYASQAQCLYALDHLGIGGLAEFICEAEEWAEQLETWTDERIRASP